MRRRVVRAVTVLFAVIAVVSTASCTRTMGGDAERARVAAPDPDRSYGYIDDRCGLLLDDTVAELLEAETLARPYSGAVCQYVLSAPTGLIDVVYTWFETGSFERERDLAEQRGAEVTEEDVARHPAFLTRRPDNAAACGATAAAGSGVLSWWVQYRPETSPVASLAPNAGGDPCEAAQKLLSATLMGDL